MSTAITLDPFQGLRLFEDLTIMLPKKEAAKPRQVKVAVQGTDGK